MAITVAKELDTKRGNFIFIGNLDEIIVPPPGRSGRKFPASEEEVASLAASIEQDGQEQAIKVRKVDGDRVELIYGHTRLRAFKLLRSCGSELPIKAEVIRCNESEAMNHTIVENLHRKQTSPIDDAFNQRVLRDQYGKTDKEIAERYRWSVAKVQQYAGLMSLPDDIQLKVHTGELAVAGALHLLAVDSPAEQRAIVEAATPMPQEVGINEAVNGKPPKKPRINGSKIKELTRDAKQQKGKRMARTVKEIRETFEAIADNDDQYHEIHAFAKAVVKFINGSVGQKAILNALEAVRQGSKK